MFLVSYCSKIRGWSDGTFPDFPQSGSGFLMNVKGCPLSEAFWTGWRVEPFRKKASTSAGKRLDVSGKTPGHSSPNAEMFRIKRLGILFWK